MDTKKFWIIGGVLVAVGSLVIAYKQYQANLAAQAEAANSQNNSGLSDADLAYLMMQQPLSYSSSLGSNGGETVNTGDSAVQSILNAILGNGSTTGTTSTSSSASSSTSSSTTTSPPNTSVGQTINPPTAIIKGLGAAPVTSVGSFNTQPLIQEVAP